MRARTLAALMAVLLLSWPVAAQDQRGTIEGTVKDASGAVLPGVTVEAKTATGAVLSATSDASGGFRFPSVVPGRLRSDARPWRALRRRSSADVNVGLGQIKRLEFALSLAGVAETVSVTAESPIVDIKQNARQTNIRAEQVDLLPHGRDFTTLVTQAPGANQESEARWSLDRRRERRREPLHHRRHRDDQPAERHLGQEPDRRLRRRSAGQVERLHGRVRRRHGRRHQRRHQERLERLPRHRRVQLPRRCALQWKRSGSRSDVRLVYQHRRPSLRLNLADATKAEYITYPEDADTRIEPGFALGGPIAVNRAWFYGAYMPALTSTTRDVDAASSGNPAANATSIKQTQQTQFLTLNQTAQLGQNLRSRVAFNNSWAKTDGLLPAPNGTDPSGTNYSKTSVFPELVAVGQPRLGRRRPSCSSASAAATTSPTSTTRTSPRSRGTSGIRPRTSAWRAFQSACSAQLASRASPNNLKVTRDQQTRLYFQADGTTYANFGGQHQLKFGVQVDRIGNNVLSGEAAARVSVFWDAALSSVCP